MLALRTMKSLSTCSHTMTQSALTGKAGELSPVRICASAHMPLRALLRRLVGSQRIAQTQVCSALVRREGVPQATASIQPPSTASGPDLQQRYAQSRMSNRLQGLNTRRRLRISS
eukprot:3731265-Pleurochrysis_carterae.AAC.3